jgi:glycosyltransferase involved in cell wall biosynthesis
MSNFRHPEYYAPLVAWRLNRLMMLALKRAGRVLCVSRCVRDDVARDFNVPPERLAVAYNGVGSHFVPTPPDEARTVVEARWGIGYPYVLFVGRLQARKNVVRLVRAFDLYRRRTGSETKLLLAGRRAATSDGIDATIAELGLEHHVVEAGYVKSHDLPALYSAARMFVFPSLWEGFGIPVVEAMACGTPVIASAVTSLPEVAGDAGLLVDPASVDEIAEAMVRVESSPDLRQTLVTRGLARARQFTWQNCARTTLDAYGEMGVRS